MHVECQNCGAKINIPDDKITPGKDFSFTCPKCRTQNTAVTPTSGNATSGPAPAAPELEVDDTAVGEFYEEGVKLALICFPSGTTRERLARIMTDLDFHPVLPESTRDALSRIKVTQFDAILLDESFDWQAKTLHPILMTLQPMIMSLRRYIWVGLFGDEYQSLDNMRAFQLSVNAVISKKDEEIFDKIIRKSLADHDRFYKVYFETAQSFGKV